MSDTLSDVSPDLRNHLLSLRSLSPYGILAVECPAGKPLYIWWGDRSQALAASVRVTHGIHTEEDEGTQEVDDDDDENDDRQFELFEPLAFPQPCGQYL